MTTHTVRQRAFRQALEREAGADATPAAVAAACRRLCERFAQHLSPLIGDAGAAAIHARSLHLAQRHVAGFIPPHTPEPDEAIFLRIQLSLQRQDASVALDAAVAVIAGVSDLLTSFIGENLTARLLRETWPDDFAGDPAGETTT
jgi:hypothetical protein